MKFYVEVNTMTEIDYQSYLSGDYCYHVNTVRKIISMEKDSKEKYENELKTKLEKIFAHVQILIYSLENTCKLDLSCAKHQKIETMEEQVIDYNILKTFIVEGIDK